MASRPTTSGRDKNSSFSLRYISVDNIPDDICIDFYFGKATLLSLLFLPSFAAPSEAVTPNTHLTQLQKLPPFDIVFKLRVVALATRFANQLNTYRTIGFYKAMLAILIKPICFAKEAAKQISLIAAAQQIGVLCTVCAHLAPLNQKRKPQA